MEEFVRAPFLTLVRLPLSSWQSGKEEETLGYLPRAHPLYEVGQVI